MNWPLYGYCDNNYAQEIFISLRVVVSANWKLTLYPKRNGHCIEMRLNQVGCVNLVTNAIIVWNTIYIDQVVQQRRQEGYSIDDEDLKHIWPTRHAHINVYGQYHFDRQRFGKSHPLRDLRNPSS